MTEFSKKKKDLAVMTRKCAKLEGLALQSRTSVSIKRVLQDGWAIQQNTEVIVQRVRLHLLFIRGVKAVSDCTNAATGPKLHTYDCIEQKVALGDNSWWTWVSQLTSIISLAAPFTPLCPFSQTHFIHFQCLFLTNLFITLQLQLICCG